jgi:hypothetical protein
VLCFLCCSSWSFTSRLLSICVNCLQNLKWFCLYFGARHYRTPTLRSESQHCRISFLVFLALIFYRKFCWFLCSSLVYSVDIGPNITVLCSSVHFLGLMWNLGLQSWCCSHKSRTFIGSHSPPSGHLIGPSVPFEVEWGLLSMGVIYKNSSNIVPLTSFSDTHINTRPVWWVASPCPICGLL